MEIKTSVTETLFVSENELKKVYIMGSEIQPRVRRAQKPEIQISRVTYILIKQLFLAIFSKFNRTNLISLMKFTHPIWNTADEI
jgi:hypothetical protein